MNDKELTKGQRSVCNDYKLEFKAYVRNDNKLKYVRNNMKLQQLGTKVKEPPSSRQNEGMSVMTIN